MNFWINNPGSNKDSVSLTLSVVGFIFTMIFATALMVAAWVTGKPEYLNNLAMIATALLTPTLGAYVSRAYTDAKFNTPAKVLTEDEEK